MNNDIYERLAKFIMFGGGKTVRDLNTLLNNYGLVYRKNKSFDDIDIAVKKSYKNGRMKTECELGMLEIYVSQIFKKATKIKEVI